MHVYVQDHSKGINRFLDSFLLLLRLSVLSSRTNNRRLFRLFPPQKAVMYHQKLDLDCYRYSLVLVLQTSC